MTSDLAAMDEAITEISEELARMGHGNPGAEAAARANARVQAVKEPRTYQKGNGRSYFRDLILSQRGVDPTGEATERLRRHAIDVATGKEYRDLDTSDGNGGFFVPPAHLTSQWAPLARAGRATADLCTRLPLPAGTNSINIPKVTSGTAVDFQGDENTAIAERDLEDASYEARVRTIAGGQDVSLQLLEQSPIRFDEVIIGDLMADHAVKVDRAVLAGTGTNGQVRGIHNTPAIQTVAIASALTIEN
ncbi:phage major capsid protein, partial [Mycolicibacterium thermoresistibile]